MHLPKSDKYLFFCLGLLTGYQMGMVDVVGRKPMNPIDSSVTTQILFSNGLFLKGRDDLVPHQTIEISKQSD
jgi:hypothetical protein